MQKQCTRCYHTTESKYVNYCGACGSTFLPKENCINCNKEIDYDIQRACFSNEDDKPLCQECWDNRY